MRRLYGPALVAAGVIALLVTTVTAQRPHHRADDGNARGAAGRDQKETRISQQQMENLDARIATATAIASRFEAEAKSRGLGTGWRQATLETLLPLSLEGLRQVEQQAFNLDALAGATKGAAADPSLLGDLHKDLVYFPLTPCRYIDTRNYAAGKINGVRGFDLDQAGSAYGGVLPCFPRSNIGLVNASQIGALAMNVTLFDTSTGGAPGFVAVKPTPASFVTSLLNWYDQGPTVQVANQGIVSLNHVGPVDEFVIETSGAVHIIVDVFGAFVAPEATALQTATPASAVNVPNLAAATLETPQCPGGFTLTGGGCYTGDFGHYLSASIRGSNNWVCRSHNTSGVPSTLQAEAICSRTRGR